MLCLVRTVLAALAAARFAKVGAICALGAPQRLSAEVAVICSARPAAHHTHHVSKSPNLLDLPPLRTVNTALLYKGSSWTLLC